MGKSQLLGGVVPKQADGSVVQSRGRLDLCAEAGIVSVSMATCSALLGCEWLADAHHSGGL